MSFDTDMAAETQRYLKDAYAEDHTIEELLNHPRWERVYMWWKALDYYGKRPFPSGWTLEFIKDVYGDD